MADRWLESLMKAVPAPERRETKSDPFLDAVFSRPGDDTVDDVTPAEMSKVFDDGNERIPDSAEAFFKWQDTGRSLAKRALAKDAPLELFMRLSKVDEEQRLVYGVATSEVADRDNEILDYENSKPHFKAWSESVQKDSQGKSKGNVREMHRASAVGTLADIHFNDGQKQIEICAKITDDVAWKKVLSRTYTGFSIGGRYASTTPDVGGLTRFVAVPSEVSLVDRPSCPDSVFTLVKSDGTTEICKFNDRHGGTMTAEEHMAGLHRRHSTYFTESAKSHKDMAAHHETLAAHFKKAVDDEGTAAHKAHAALAECHHDCAMKDSGLASWHHNTMEECEKAQAAAMTKAAESVPPSALEDAVRATFIKIFGDTVIPTRVSAVAPPRTGVVAVIRPGMPEIKAAPVDERFAKVLGLTEEDLHVDERSVQ
jgi:hypothetical protein